MKGSFAGLPKGRPTGSGDGGRGRPGIAAPGEPATGREVVTAAAETSGDEATGIVETGAEAAGTGNGADVGDAGGGSPVGAAEAASADADADGDADVSSDLERGAEPSTRTTASVQIAAVMTADATTIERIRLFRRCSPSSCRATERSIFSAELNPWNETCGAALAAALGASEGCFPSIARSMAAASSVIDW